jgi:hypothetical protein
MGYGEILEDDTKIADYLTSVSHALLRGYGNDSLAGGKMKLSLIENYDALK